MIGFMQQLYFILGQDREEEVGSNWNVPHDYTWPKNANKCTYLADQLHRTRLCK